MGESFNTFQSLEPPLHFADERVIFIPKDRLLDVENRGFKIIVVLDGTADLEIDDRYFGRLGRGDILVVPTACQQSYSPVTRQELRLHVMRLFFDLGRPSPKPASRAKKRRTASAAIERTDLRRFLREYFQRPIIFTPPRGSRVHDWVREIQTENERRAAGYGLRIGALCRMIGVELARFGEDGSATRPPAAAGSRNQSSDAGRPPNWATEHVKQFLYDNFHRPLTLDHIAWEVRLSNEHLCRRFKKHTGQTVFCYLRQLRVDAAKAYLTSSKHSVTEISRRVGFSSATLFCRTFRTVVGMPPAAFRRQKAAHISFERTSLRPTDSDE